MPQTITTKVLFFASAKDLTNKSQSTLTVNSDQKYNLKSIKSTLIEAFPELVNLLSPYTVALNEEYVEDKVECDIIFKEADVIAVIPPLSGG